MSTNAYEFIIRLRDEASVALRNVGTGIDGMHGRLMKAEASWRDMGQRMIAFNQTAQALQQSFAAIDTLTQPGVALQTSMADLKAITGLADGQVKELGKSARRLGIEFGTNAARGVESYKLLLSQLSPELAKNPEVLDRMARSANHLSKTMGGDTVAATQVLTTAMNQFQVDLQNPIRAAAEMERMMNTMSAAAVEGSAELPAIQAALQVAGLAAKTANVSFEETNAAIQVLDKAGRRGAEGGTALRNVMNTLARGRFLPPRVQEELEAAGISVDHLGDQSLSLADRLKPLQAVMHDGALMTKLFDEANASSAIALISNIGAMETMTGQITGTNTAMEQSAIIMDTKAEKANRLKARFNDFGVTLFNTFKGILPLTAGLGQTALLITQLVPAVDLMRTAFVKAYKEVGNFTTSMKGMTAAKLAARIGIIKYTAGVQGATKAKIAFNKAFLLSPIGIAIMGITAVAGAFLLLRRRIDDTTAAQKALSEIQKTAEQNTVKERVEVQRLAGVMHDKNTTLEQRRTAYNRLIEISPEYFGKLSFEEAQTKDLTIVVDEYIAALIHKAQVKAKEDRLKALYEQTDLLQRDLNESAPDFLQTVGNLLLGSGGATFATRQAQTALRNQQSALARLQAEKAVLTGSLRERKYEELLGRPQPAGTTVPGIGGDSPTPGAEGEIEQGISTITGGGARHTNINISIGSLVETFTVHTQNMRESADQIHDMVVDALLRSVNSANAAAGN